MRELEFLPDWYPKLRRRRQTVALQAWGTIAIAAALGLWLLLAQRNVHARQRELTNLSSSLTQSIADVDRLKELEQLHEQLQSQDQVFAMIGRPIEMTRVLTTLQEAMPQDMSILDLSVKTEVIKPKTLAGKLQEEKGSNRSLKLDLQGVAPSDTDLASFLAKLTAKPFFSDVALVYSKPLTQSGHNMREFEVTFALKLSDLGG